MFNYILRFTLIFLLCASFNLLQSGCTTTSSHSGSANQEEEALSKAEEKAQKQKEKENRKKLSILKFFLETSSGSNADIKEVQVFRAWPETIYISTEAFLDERDFQEVNLIDSPDGTFQIEFILTSEGSAILQNITGRYRGRRIVIFGNFGDPRFLGAPKIEKVITDGRITITPDASLEEAERFVLGMKNTIRTIKRKEQGL